MSRDFVAIAEKYARDVLDGTIPACKFNKQAAQRYLDDLSNGVEGYTFNKDRATHVCKVIEMLPHVKGKWAGTPIHLEPWQVFILVAVFGWVDGDGMRRFNTVYIEVARKNAKSTLTSAVGLYCLTFDDEAGAECYSAATTRDQARIVFQDAQRMVKMSAGFRERTGAKAHAHAVTCEATNSSFKALSAEGSTLDGLNIHFASVDELHAHKTRAVWEVLETGTGARTQPLLWAITTAGSDRSGICYEQRAYVIKLLNGSAKDDSYFGIIFTIDDDDDWTDPKCWQKANPNFGVSVNPQDLERKARKAVQMPSATNGFLTKHLDVWVNADTAWMNMVAWENCGDDEKTLDDFEDWELILGLDLASKVDIASLSYLFRKGKKYGLVVENFLPEETIEASKNSQYDGWEQSGRLISTPGNVIDYDIIEQRIENAAKRFNLLECAYDPFQATQLSTRMIEQGIEMVEVRPTTLNFSEPMKELEKIVISDELVHDNCPVMNWMVSNTVCHRDAKDNIYPRKEFDDNKIDGVVATVTALSRFMNREDGTSVYEHKGVAVL